MTVTVSIRKKKFCVVDGGGVHVCVMKTMIIISFVSKIIKTAT